jgi:hypothetical protein
MWHVADSKKGWMLFGALLLAGCAAASPPSSPEVWRAAAQVRLMDGPPVRPHFKIRSVHARVCARAITSDLDVASAREHLRFEAARVGGDVVGNVMCQEEDALASRDCWRIASCTGDAFRLR